MKKLISLLLILSLLLVGCAKKTEGSETAASSSTLISDETEEMNYVQVSADEVSIESLRSEEITYTLLTDTPVIISVLDESVATASDNNGTITIQTYKEGETFLEFRAEGKIVKQVKIKVEKQFITFPLASNLLVLKGKNVVADVKAVLTEEIDGVTPQWTVADEKICSIETQGLICRITSLSKGTTTITLTYGEHSESFTVKVTNIRGEL